jgi:hypothetical protein
MMAGRFAAGAVLGMVLASAASAQPSVRQPGWFLAPTYPDPGGRMPVGHGGKVLPPQAGGGLMAGCADDITRICTTGQTGFYGARECLSRNMGRLSPACRVSIAALPPPSVPACVRSPVCDNPLGGRRTDLMRVEWKQTMGYRFAYPMDLPRGGGATGVGIDSKGNIWVLQRAAPGKPPLLEFDSHFKLVRQVGEDITGRLEKAHGIKVDGQDNVWITDANKSVVLKISPQGKLLMTLGVRGKRGDWDEPKGRRLLWQPLDVAFGKAGDIFIGEGHSNESPNDTGLEPGNTVGAARVIHLDAKGRFLNQWYGNAVGQGKFSMAHGVAVDPKNGDVWIADREQYRLLVYRPDGKFVKTLQMRNLTCAIGFDPQGNPWISSGLDGQLLKLDRDGHVLGAVGNGSGIGTGQFIEATYMAWDKAGNVYSGDTSVGRVTQMIAPH